MEKRLAEEFAIFTDLTGDFPFADEASRAHAFCLWVVQAVSEKIDGPTPLHVIEGPSGVGKSLLAEVLLIQEGGKDLDVMTLGRNEDEIRKRLNGPIQRGDTVVIDNVNRKLGASCLECMLTARAYQDRVLGKKETFTVPITSIFVANGCEMRMSEEMARRSVGIKLESGPIPPTEEAKFLHPDLWSYARGLRGVISDAIRELTKWECVIGPATPYSGPVLGGFEQWSRLMGAICEEVGLLGFLGNARENWERWTG